MFDTYATLFSGRLRLPRVNRANRDQDKRRHYGMQVETVKKPETVDIYFVIVPK